MKKDTVVSLKKPAAESDPLSSLLREGARHMARPGAVQPGTVYWAPGRPLCILPVRRGYALLYRSGIRHLRDEGRTGSCIVTGETAAEPAPHGTHGTARHYLRAVRRYAGHTFGGVVSFTYKTCLSQSRGPAQVIPRRRHRRPDRRVPAYRALPQIPACRHSRDPVPGAPVPGDPGTPGETSRAA